MIEEHATGQLTFVSRPPMGVAVHETAHAGFLYSVCFQQVYEQQVSWQKWQLEEHNLCSQQFNTGLERVMLPSNTTNCVNNPSASSRKVLYPNVFL